MTPKALTALQDSIEVWEAKLAHPWHIRKFWRTDCPLCNKFNLPDLTFSHDLCKGCPVAEETQRRFCADTPFGEAQFLHNKAHRQKTHENLNPTPETLEKLDNAVQAEIDFLKSLLPENQEG